LFGAWRATVGLDAATALCSAFNLTYFLLRSVRHRRQRASRTVAALALALISLAALGESLYFLASLTAVSAGSPLAALLWTLARGLSLAGMGLLSALILRRLVADAWPELHGQ
jgi:uncharacterized membrane protein